MDGISLFCIVLYHIVLHCVAIFCNASYYDALLKSSTIRWFGRVRMEISWARTLTSVASTTPYMATRKKSDIKQYSANTFTDTVQCKYIYRYSTVQMKIQKQTQYSESTNTTTVQRQVARSLIIELSRLGQLHTSLSLVKNQTYSESIFSPSMPA